MLSKLIIYGVFQGLIVVVSLLTMIYVTKHVSPSEYAIYGVFLSIAALFQPLASFSCERLVQVKKHSLSNDKYQVFIGELIALTAISSFIIAFLCFIYFSLFSTQATTLLIGIFVAFRSLKSFKLFEYNIENRTIKYGLVGLSVKVLAFIFIYVFFEVYSANANYLILSIFIAEVSISLLINNNRVIPFRTINKAQFKPFLKFGLPLVIATIPAWIAHDSGRVILDRFSSAEAGILTFGLQLAGVYMLFNSALGNAVVKDVYLAYESRSLGKVILKITSLQVLVSILFMTVFHYSGDLFLDEKFISVNECFYYLVLGFLIQSFSLVPVYLASYDGKTKFVLKANAFAALAFIFYVLLCLEAITAVTIAQGFLFSMLTYSTVLWFQYFNSASTFTSINKS
ncbi:oligosaccharide flippase family protein [Pseudoalteromonas sp. DL-6]|uniref:oligosaccharide flippase family protein n=1 Tax=Pseudoalteromonas sp. DL-6 TaxID=1390185 RepID=UPI0010400303|nr:oligosaccharide flippase family protein [Pseudoalteromonas sp. DL-6]QBJ61969.1 hypothetical protein B1F84_02415 [Pseudoalteromonas sp. DL-6]